MKAYDKLCKTKFWSNIALYSAQYDLHILDWHLILYLILISSNVRNMVWATTSWSSLLCARRKNEFCRFAVSDHENHFEHGEQFRQ